MTEKTEPADDLGPEPFARGDFVRFKTGSPPMTVIMCWVDDDNNGYVVEAGFFAANAYRTVDYVPAYMLERHDAAAAAKQELDDWDRMLREQRAARITLLQNP